MTEYFVVVVNVSEPDQKDNRFDVKRNWDVKEFAKYPDVSEMQLAVQSLDFEGRKVTLNYAKVEKRYKI